MSTVWDVEPDQPAPRHDPVSGRLEGGGAGIGLEVFADLAVQLGGMCAQLKRRNDALARQLAALPADYQNAAGGPFPVSGTLALNLGSPDLGTEWEVRRIIIGGADITTTPIGVGWVFVQGSPPNMNGVNPSTAQAADVTAGALPQRAFYGTHELVVDATEYLWVVIVGGTPGTQYVASVKAEVVDLAAKASFGSL